MIRVYKDEDTTVEAVKVMLRFIKNIVDRELTYSTDIMDDVDVCYASHVYLDDWEVQACSISTDDLCIQLDKDDFSCYLRGNEVSIYDSLKKY